MRQYEIQVLDSYNNRTYADGMMASIYGEWPPLVNVARKPGEWQSIDIMFEAPRFSGKVSPGYFTILWNGVMVHNRTQLLGATTAVLTPHAYTAHEAELPVQLRAVRAFATATSGFVASRHTITAPTAVVHTTADRRRGGTLRPAAGYLRAVADQRHQLRSRPRRSSVSSLRADAPDESRIDGDPCCPHSRRI